MSEQEQQKEFEGLASPAQAQTVLDEVNRLLEPVRLQDVREGIQPWKAARIEDVNISLYPEGQPHPDDPDVSKLASMSWGEKTESGNVSTSFSVERQPSGKLALTKIINFSTWPIEGTTHDGKAANTPDQVVDRLGGALAALNTKKETRREERMLGLHAASTEDVTTLLEKLKGLSETPKPW